MTRTTSHPQRSESRARRVQTASVVEEVFLSPRIVDDAAMTDYADRLKALIEEAERAADALGASAGEGRSVLATLAPATGRLRRALESAQRLTRIIEERAARFDGASRAFGDADRKFEDAAQAALEPIDARLEALHSRVDALIADAQAQAAELADATAARLAQRIDPLRERAEAAAARVETALTNIDEQCESALTSLVERVNDQIERLTSAIERARSDAAETEARLQAAAQTCAAHMDERIAAAGACADNLETRAADAERAARVSTDRLESVRRQADAARALLGRALLAAAPLIDNFEAHRQALEDAAALAQADSSCSAEG